MLSFIINYHSQPCELKVLKVGMLVPTFGSKVLLTHNKNEVDKVDLEALQGSARYVLLYSVKLYLN